MHVLRGHWSIIIFLLDCDILTLLTSSLVLHCYVLVDVGFAGVEAGHLVWKWLQQTAVRQRVHVHLTGMLVVCLYSLAWPALRLAGASAGYWMA
jgi:hypothetical protein